MNATIKPCDSFDYTMLDGYAWAEQQANSIHGALHADPAMGEWPYLVIVRGNRQGKYVIKQYCEHDVSTWVYTESERDQYTNHLKQLRDQ